MRFPSFVVESFSLGFKICISPILEEFIRGKRCIKELTEKGGIGGGLDLRPIDEDGPNDDDGFFDIGLDLSGRGDIPPEDPSTLIGGGASKMMATKGETEANCTPWEEVGRGGGTI